MILLHGGNRILPVLTDDLAEFSHRVLERRGVEIRLNTRIQSATAQAAILSGGDTIATRTLVAAIGSGPNQLLDSVPGARDDKGRLVVNESLAVPGHAGIWAVGDCAAIPDVRKGGACPPTAQYALREAKHVAKNILAAINGKALRMDLSALREIGRATQGVRLIRLDENDKLVAVARIAKEEEEEETSADSEGEVNKDEPIDH